MLSTMPNAGEWNAEAKTMLYTNHKLRRCAARDVTIGSWIQVDYMHTVYAGIFNHMLYAMKKNIT